MTNSQKAPQVSLDNPHDAQNPPSRLSVPVQKGLIIGFVLWLLVSLLLFFAGYWRRGGVSLGLDFIYLGVLRWFADSKYLGVLAVRSKKFDTIFCIVLGVLMVYLALSVDSLGS